MNDWVKLFLVIIGLDFLFGEDDSCLEEEIYMEEDC